MQSHSVDKRVLEKRFINYLCTNMVANQMLEGQEAGKVWNKYRTQLELLTADLKMCLNIDNSESSEK